MNIGRENAQLMLLPLILTENIISMFCCRSVLKRILRRELCSLRYEANDSPKVVLVPQLDETVLEGLKEGTMAARKHPGKNQTGQAVSMDDEMIETIKKILKDSMVKILLKDAQKYLDYTYVRQAPASKVEQMDKSAVCYWEVYNKSKVNFYELSAEEFKREEEKLKRKADVLLASRTYAWKPIEYTEYVGKQYLIERMVPEYAVLNKIFNEIAIRCPDFRPHSLFDLGSGIGTVTFVARKFWQDCINEYYNVDPSNEMNQLAKLILTKGVAEAPLPIQNVYYRQFLPSKTDRKYSLTVCSYSLLEFPSSSTRLESLWKLWSKTEDFMVLVERGNATGFKLILEARDFILNTEENSKSNTGIHVFAPCPHELDCPLLKTWSKTCRFKTPYERLPIGRTRFTFNEYFTYVVLRRGKRPENDPQWPRVLRPPTKKKRRAVCHLCTKNGKLCSYMFRKAKHGTTYYTFGKTVKAGDRLPVTFTKCDLSDFDENDDLIEEVTSAEELQQFDDDELDDGQKEPE